MLPKEWHSEISYFTNNEFASKILIDDEPVFKSSDEITEKYNEDKYSPVDGQIIRGCDHLSAYLEAYLSLKYGVQSESVQSGYHNIFNKYDNKVIGGIDFGLLFDYFRL